MPKNVETVQGIYEAFGRGDIPAILEQVAENVAWEYTIDSTNVPWLQPLHGPAEVPQFFEALGALDFHHFEPKTFLENGNIVVVLLDVDLTVKATGLRITEEDEIHIWRFNEAGKVTKFGHKLDTHQHWMAYNDAVPERV